MPILDSLHSSPLGGSASLVHGMAAACRQLGQTVADALFPATCLGCDRLYRIRRCEGAAIRGASDEAPNGAPIQNTLEAYLCEDCRSRFRTVDPPMCSCCGLPFASPAGMDHLCPECQSRPPRYAMARAAGVFEGALQHTLHHFKYGRRESLAKPLGRMLWQVLCTNWQPAHFSRVVPVPLHPSRLRQRKFNQANALVREWPRLARMGGWDPPGGWLSPGVLQRCRATRSQTGLHKVQRQANLSGAFVLTAGETVQGLRILLVDDVMTTGATVDACTQVLLAGGAREVKVLTVARALR